MVNQDYADTVNAQFATQSRGQSLAYYASRSMTFVVEHSAVGNLAVGTYNYSSSMGIYYFIDADNLSERFYSFETRTVQILAVINSTAVIRFYFTRDDFDDNEPIYIVGFQWNVQGYNIRFNLPRPVYWTYAGNDTYDITDVNLIYSSPSAELTITPINETMFRLTLDSLEGISGVPVYVGIPSEIDGRHATDTCYRFDRVGQSHMVNGYVDNRTLIAFPIAPITPNSVALFSAHTHFEPFASPDIIDDLRRQGISVYVDNVGLIHFSEHDDYLRYLTSFIAGEKFNMEWLESRDIAKENFGAVAADLPDKLIAAKTRMVDNYEAALNNGALERGLEKYNDPEVLSELFAQKLDSIVEIEQAKIEKLVRSVIKKRQLSDRIDDIADYLQNNPDSPVVYPAGLSRPAIKSLISQPISKFMDRISVEATDAAIVDEISDYLINKLGFQRRVGV